MTDTKRSATRARDDLEGRLRAPQDALELHELGGRSRRPTRGQLARMVDSAPRLRAAASEARDGRRVPVVLALARDASGPRGGVAVRLLDAAGGTLLDRTTTDAAGMALLRFGARERDDATTGVLEVTGLDDPVAVEVPADAQHVLVELGLADLEVGGDDTDLGSLAGTITGDDLLSRLPAEFSPALAEAVDRLAPSLPDPIFSLVEGVDGRDFRTRRHPLLKRLSVVRTIPPAEDGGAPRRVLVRVRQEWKFLTYTLGELTSIEALDPGTVLQETTRTASGTVQDTRRDVQEAVALATSQLSRVLNELQSVSTVVSEAATQTTKTLTEALPNPAYANQAGVGVHAGADPGGVGGIAGAAAGAAGGFAIGGPVGAIIGGIGGFFAGGGSAEAGVSVTLPSVGVPPTIAGPTETTITDTLQAVDSTSTTKRVNDLVTTASERTSQAVREVVGQIRRLESVSGRTIDRVSPLLSAVTNLLRWTMYQNYLVTTHVEDVLELREVRITAPDEGADLFSDQDVVEYAPFFVPGLLARHLLPQFDVLAAQLAGPAPTTTAVHVRLQVEVPAGAGTLPLLGGALGQGQVGAVRVELEGGGFRTVPLRLGHGPVVGFTLPTSPLVPGTSRRLDLEVGCGEMVAALAGHLPGLVDTDALRLGVRAITVAAGGVVLLEERFGDAAMVSARSKHVALSRDLQVPAAAAERSANPLTRHVNRNRTHYLGLLLRAALANPALRDDAPQLAAFRSDHPLWRMPVAEVEGDRVRVLVEPDPKDPEVRRLLDDPGTASIQQLAAPGQYAEALQGLLRLDDALGRLHPALAEPPAPAMPPLALVDMAGRVVPVDQPEG